MRVIWFNPREPRICVLDGEKLVLRGGRVVCRKCGYREPTRQDSRPYRSSRPASHPPVDVEG